MFSMSVTPSVQFRDALGRFASFKMADSAQQRLVALGQSTVVSQANATPVRTGAMRAGWRQTYAPSQMQVAITNQAPYVGYVVFGTRRMPPNPALQAVLAGLPDQAQATGGAILGDLRVSLVGG